MAIEKLPAAPVNLSGGSLLSRQPSNIPEGNNLLGNAVDSIVRAYEPTLKAAAVKEAEANAAVVGVIRGPGGEFIRPPEPDGGLIYNEVYNKAVDQTYASSIAYDFQIKADKIVADNYTDPQKAIALMNATLTGAMKGMDPRFASVVTPILQNELQQRSAGVLNRKAGDDREALNRTSGEMLDSHLNSYMDAWKTGNTAKADQFGSLIVDTARNQIALNLYTEGYLNAIDAKMEIAKSRGLKAGEIEDRTRKIESLQLRELADKTRELDVSVSSMGAILAATTLINPDQMSDLSDIANGDTRKTLNIQIPTPDGKSQTVTLDAATYRALLPNTRINNEVTSAINGMHSKNEVVRKAQEKAAEQQALRDTLSQAISVGTIPKYTAKLEAVADDGTALTFQKYTGSSVLDYKNPQHQALAVAAAKHLYRLDSATNSFLATAIRSNDPVMLNAGLNIYKNSKTAMNGKIEIGPSLLKDLSAEDIKLYDAYDILQRNQAMSQEDRVINLENIRNNRVMSYTQIQSYYENRYSDVLYQNVLKEMDLPTGDKSVVIPQQIIDDADLLTRTYAIGGDTKAALTAGVKAAARNYTRDPRSNTGIGPRNFDAIVPSDIMSIISKKDPVFLGRTLGKDAKYGITKTSNMDLPVVTIFAMDGINVVAAFQFDPATDLPVATNTSITAEQIRAANIKRFQNTDAARRLRAGMALPTDPPPPFGYDAKTGRVYNQN